MYFDFERVLPVLHLRSLGYSSLLALAIAAPASAQMTPEQVWTLLEDYMKTSGAEVAVGDSKRSGERLVLSNVTLNTTQEDIGTTTVAINEIVLRDIGDGKVEITSSPETKVMSRLTAEEGEAIENEMIVLTEGNVTIASGTPEQPVFDFTTERFSLKQKTEVADEAAPFTADISGEKLSGSVKLDLKASPRQADYKLAMEKLSVVTAGSAEGEEGEPASDFQVDLLLEKLTSSYVGSMPESSLTPTDALPALDGKLSYSTGPMVMKVKASGPMPMAAAFLSRSSALDLQFASTGGTFSYDLQGLGIASGENLPAVNESASNLAAKGEMTVPATGPNGTADLEAAYGKVTLELSGLTPLLDGIVAAKLASAEDVAGIKMMMGFFTRPGSGTDSIAVDLEQTADGKMLINGEEMP